MGGGTSTATDTNAGPSLPDLLSGQAALDNASAQAPAIAYSAGGAAVQGAIDAIAPILPYLVIVVAVLIFARR